jgi:hypothetical protein
VLSRSNTRTRSWDLRKGSPRRLRRSLGCSSHSASPLRQERQMWNRGREPPSPCNPLATRRCEIPHHETARADTADGHKPASRRTGRHLEAPSGTGSKSAWSRTKTCARMAFGRGL